MQVTRRRQAAGCDNGRAGPTADASRCRVRRCCSGPSPAQAGCLPDGSGIRYPFPLRYRADAGASTVISLPVASNPAGLVREPVLSPAVLLQADGSVLIIVLSSVHGDSPEAGVHCVVMAWGKVVTELKIVFDVDSSGRAIEQLPETPCDGLLGTLPAKVSLQM